MKTFTSGLCTEKIYKKLFNKTYIDRKIIQSFGKLESHTNFTGNKMQLCCTQIKTALFAILITLFLKSCKNNNGSSVEIPEIFITNYDKFKDSNFVFNYGDVIQIKDTEIKGIISDFSRDEDGIWYGIIFLCDDMYLFGRSIPNLIDYKCIELLDFVFLNEKAIYNIQKVDEIDINFLKVGIGSRSAVSNNEELLKMYKDGIIAREKPETPCNEKFGQLTSVNEKYIALSQILNNEL